MYCSHGCRSKASAKRSITELNGHSITQPQTNMKHDLSSYLLGEVSYYKDLYAKSQAELAELKSAASGREGGGLAGLSDLMDSPLGAALAPSIGKIFEKMVDGGAAPGLTGSDGKPDERLQQIAAFYSAQDEDMRELIFQLADMLAGVPPEEAKQKLRFWVNANKPMSKTTSQMII